MTLCVPGSEREAEAVKASRPPLVCRDREERESIMQIASAPFGQKTLPQTGTVLRKTADGSVTARACEETPHSAPVPPTLLPAVQ